MFFINNQSNSQEKYKLLQFSRFSESTLKLGDKVDSCLYLSKYQLGT